MERPGVATYDGVDIFFNGDEIDGSRSADHHIVFVPVDKCGDLPWAEKLAAHLGSTVLQGKGRRLEQCRRATEQLAQRDPDLPMGLVRRLAADPGERLRGAVAIHSRLPAGELTRLPADRAERVATAAAGNPGPPPRDVHRILALAGL
ncbi:hypothetical protein ABZ871_21320 [Streptomyces populi]